MGVVKCGYISEQKKTVTAVTSDIYSGAGGGGALGSLG